MKVFIPKRNRTIEANDAAGVLDVLREDGLLPPANLDLYKTELRNRLSSWFGTVIETNDEAELIDLLRKAGAVVVVEEEN